MHKCTGLSAGLNERVHQWEERSLGRRRRERASRPPRPQAPQLRLSASATCVTHQEPPQNSAGQATIEKRGGGGNGSPGSGHACAHTRGVVRRGLRRLAAPGVNGGGGQVCGHVPLRGKQGVGEWRTGPRAAAAAPCGASINEGCVRGTRTAAPRLPPCAAAAGAVAVLGGARPLPTGAVVQAGRTGRGAAGGLPGSSLGTFGRREAPAPGRRAGARRARGAGARLRANQLLSKTPRSRPPSGTDSTAGG